MSARGYFALVATSAVSTVVAVVGVALATTPLAPAVREAALPVAIAGLAVVVLLHRQVRRRPSRAGRAWLGVATVAPLALGCSLLSRTDGTDVTIDGGDVRLAATLVLPPGPGPHPGVVLVHGSTPQTRDSLFGLYRSVAAGLAQRGVAALVYDKRGCGDSSGDYASALFDDLSSDAAAALDWLAARDEVDSGRTGLWGISQGGWVATQAAARSEHARFLVLVSAPMSTEGEQRIFEWMQRLEREGVPEEHRREAARLQRLVWEYYGTGQGWETVSAEWERARSSPWWGVVEGLERGGPAPPDEVRSPAGWASLRWHRTDRVFDVRAALRQLSAPVLAVYGGRDRIIPMPQSYERAQNVLGERGGDLDLVQVFDEARHPLLELAPLPRFPDGYLDGVAAWIASATSAD